MILWVDNWDWTLLSGLSVSLGFTHTSVVNYKSAKWLLGLFGYQMQDGRRTRPCVSHRVGYFKSVHMAVFQVLRERAETHKAS